MVIQFSRRPGCVIGALDIGVSFPVTDSHLTDEFATQCGLTLDGGHLCVLPSFLH